MKILTLNTHSLVELDYEHKLSYFVEMICKEKPEVFALQEVNQLIAAPSVLPDENYIPASGYTGVIKEDNHAYRIAELLKQAGLTYQWSWIGAKVGYGIYDEGMALFSLNPITATKQFYISQNHCYSNWKTRKVLGIRTGDEPEWYFCMHMGWWNDEDDPFAAQWDNFQAELRVHTRGCDKIWLLGDFNSPVDKKDEGYQYIKKYRWIDTYDLAIEKDTGVTVEKVIDGWQNRDSDERIKRMRIDYIWSNYEPEIRSSRVVFNGKNYPVVSDHYGVMIEVNNKI